MFYTVFWVAFAAVAHGYPTYPAELPNGMQVPCPSHFDENASAAQCQHGVCKGVGHIDCRGGEVKSADGEFLNNFGIAFRNAGHQWTKELCEEDSDGDGKTNGEELGDPCCVWRPDQVSPVAEDYRISHPGHAEDTTDSQGPTAAECRALQESMGASTTFDREEYIDSLYNPGEERLNITFRVDNHTLLTNETIYTQVFFPLPVDQDYFMVGFLPDILNKVHVHHFVAYLCTEPYTAMYRGDWEPGFPQEPPGPRENGDVPEECLQNVYLWAPGADTFALPNNMAIKFGENTVYKSLLLEIHYNNPDNVQGQTDASGFTMFYTSQAREHEATWWWTGSIILTGTIPPKKQNFFNVAECVVDLRPGCEEVKGVAFIPHAHFLGNSIWTEHYRPNQYGQLTQIGELGREDAYNYELQYTRYMEKEISIRDGDMVSTTCMYNSMDRDAPTPGGLASREEMCINFILVYPAQCLYRTSCVEPGRIVSGTAPAGAPAPLHSSDFYSPGGAPNFTALAESNLIQCDAEAAVQSTQGSPEAAPGEALFNTFFEACPGLFGDGGFVQPETLLAYMCPAACVDHIINLGVCSVTDLQQDFEAFHTGEEMSPLDLAAPSCWEAAARKLTEMDGGVFQPVSRPSKPRAQAIPGSTPSAAPEAASTSARLHWTLKTVFRILAPFGVAVLFEY